MSYDVVVVIPGAVDPNVEVVVWEGNYTSNVSPMWTRALEDSLFNLIDRFAVAGDLASVLAHGIERMTSDPEPYRAMNPSNGWGDYDGALRYLREIEGACRNFPQARVRAWR